MQFSNQILVFSQGLTSEEEVILATAVKLLTLQGKQFKLLSENISNAHLLILNVNNDLGRKYFKESRSGQVKVLLTNSKHTGKNIISIQSPTEVSVLVDILGKLFEKMSQQIQIARDRIPRMAGITKTAGNLLTDTVFHLLLSAKENHEYLSIAAKGFPDLFIDGENQSVKTTATKEDIASIIHHPLFELNVQNLNGKIPGNVEGKISSLYHILWVSAVSCSNGQLLPGHDANKPVRLKAWPNFTRNDFKPAYLKLAAVLAQRSVALSDLEELTKVPYSDIVNFYNAAYSVDLIDNNLQSTPAKTTERKVSNEKKSLLNRIADRLGFGQQKLNTVSA